MILCTVLLNCNSNRPRDCTSPAGTWRAAAAQRCGVTARARPRPPLPLCRCPFRGWPQRSGPWRPAQQRRWDQGWVRRRIRRRQQHLPLPLESQPHPPASQRGRRQVTWPRQKGAEMGAGKTSATTRRSFYDTLRAAVASFPSLGHSACPATSTDRSCGTRNLPFALPAPPPAPTGLPPACGSTWTPPAGAAPGPAAPVAPGQGTGRGMPAAEEVASRGSCTAGGKGAWTKCIRLQSPCTRHTHTLPVHPYGTPPPRLPSRKGVLTCRPQGWTAPLPVLGLPQARPLPTPRLEAGTLQRLPPPPRQPPPQPLEPVEGGRRRLQK